MYTDFPVCAGMTGFTPGADVENELLLSQATGIAGPDEFCTALIFRAPFASTEIGKNVVELYPSG
jgi:hypothetical protein